MIEGAMPVSQSAATGHADDCFLSGGDDGRFPCICGHSQRVRDVIATALAKDKIAAMRPNGATQ